MNIYIYSDESGVFDYKHDKYYVFAGLIVIGDETRDDERRKYAKVELDVRNSTGIKGELKAAVLPDKYKMKIFRSLNNCHRFAGIIEQKRVNDNIWKSKKDKQRYLDYVYKISVKRALEELINQGIIIPKDVEKITFYVDEHTTATNGCYELREGLEQELKNGTYNMNYSFFFPPLFPDLKVVDLQYLNSATPKNRLVRAADIIANVVYHYATIEDFEKLKTFSNLHYVIQP